MFNCVRSIVVASFFCGAVSLQASDYGTTGLIDTPTARSGADGDFTTTLSYQDRSKSVAISYQALPWLEATFRYTGFNEFFYYDRNYEVKARLWRERGWLPQVAIGIRDAVGTGVFGAEYIVANKRFGNVDASLGLGWGRLAGNGVVDNPLSIFSDAFKNRQKDVGVGGTVSTGQFFRGEQVGLFGGLSYQFDHLPLKALVEYNPDQYQWEVNRGGQKPKTPWSYGLAWEFSRGLSLTFSHQHGQDIGITFQGRFSSMTPAPTYEPEPMLSSQAMLENDLPAGYNKDVWYDMLLLDIARIGVPLNKGQITPDGKKATLQITNHSYAYWPDAISKAHLFAEMHLPSSVETVDYIVEENSHQVMNIELPRSLAAGITLDSRDVQNAKIREYEPIKGVAYETNLVRKNVTFNVELDHRVMLFDPNNPLAYQLFLDLSTKIPLPGGINLKSAYAFDVMNNVEGMTRNSTSVLPHVRSDALLYLQKGKNGLRQLLLDKRGTLATNWHYRAYGGVLESMYSGVGGEVLYSPVHSSLAFGASANWVKQRDYDGSLRHLDYSTSTAFVSAYWATPFNNYDVAIHAGKYLAKDVGATVELRRTFNNGWMVGLWATLTDVPFEEFGEGSFDKGMYFRIPLGALGSSGRSAYTSRIRPIQRDGGARLEGYSGNLWWDLREARYDVFKGGRF